MSLPDFFRPLPSQTPTFSGSTLLLPSVSLAHIPQLSCDLLITNLEFHKIGNLSSRWNVPVAGSDGQGGIMSAVEVFQTNDAKFTIIQPHSPVLKSQKSDYISALSAFISSESFSRILIIGSLDAASRIDEHLTSGELIYRLTLSPPGFLPASIPQFSNTDNNKVPYLPLSGLTRPLLSKLCGIKPLEGSGSETLPITSTSPQIDCLLIYTGEGDSRRAAHTFANRIADSLELGGRPEWKEPSSWDGGLWGRGDGSELLAEYVG